MTALRDSSPKFLQYLPLGVLAFSIVASYVTLQQDVNALRTTQKESDAIITNREVKLRLDTLQSDVTEIKRDIKDLSRRQTK